MTSATTHPAGAPAELTGKELRRLTAQLRASDAGASVMSVIGDAYTAVLAAAISFGLALGLAGAIGGLVPARSAQGVPDGVKGLTSWLLVVLAVASVGSIAGRFGPVGSDSAEVVWWLSAPADRRGLLRPRAWQAIGLAGLVLAAVFPLALVTVGVPASGSAYAASALLGLACGIGLVAVLTLLEREARARRVATLTCDIVLFLAPVAAALAAWRLHTLVPFGPPPLWLAVGLIVVAAAAAILADAWLGRLPERVLHASGTAMGGAIAALRSLDTRELSHSLAEAFGRRRPRRPALLLALVRGPISAVAAAEAITLLRSPRRLLQFLLTAAAPILVMLLSSDLPSLGRRLIAVVMIVVGGYLAATTCVEPARQAYRTPALDTLAPLSGHAARLARLIVSGVLMLAWAALVGSVIGALLGTGKVVPMALAAAPAIVAAALRGAYRPAPNFANAMLVTPMGSLPPGAMAVLREGPDVAMFACLPLVLAVISTLPLTWLLPAQLATSALAVWFATKPREEKVQAGQRQRDREKRDAQI